jgi:DsbC/DsbD-like thiol-disulfide interchange protein
MIRLWSSARSAIVAILLMAAVSGTAAAQRGALNATLTGRRTSLASDTVALRIALQMTPGWHIGAAKPGKFGVPTVLTWGLPAGWRVLAERWAAPTRSVVGRDTVFEYRGPFTIDATLVTQGGKRSGPVEAVVAYGICRDVCMPGQLTLTYMVR